MEDEDPASQPEDVIVNRQRAGQLIERWAEPWRTVTIFHSSRGRLVREFISQLTEAYPSHLRIYSGFEWHTLLVRSEPAWNRLLDFVRTHRFEAVGDLPKEWRYEQQ